MGRQFERAYYANKPGVPAIFPASQFTELKGLKGKQGAKPILMAAKDNRKSASDGQCTF